MSAEATGWVFRHSPMLGTAFAVHLAIADSVNEANGYQFWARQAWLAAKARTTRKTVWEALGKLEAEGLLVLQQTQAGGTNLYRLLMPAGLPDRLAKSLPGPAGGATARSTQAGRGASPGRTGVLPGVTGGATSGRKGVLPDVAHNPRGTQRNPTDNPAPIGKPTGSGGAAAAEAMRVAADQLARADWERRDPKPVIKFPAFRARVLDALQAGYTPEQLANVLPGMTVFTRSTFDVALRGFPRARVAATPDAGMMTNREAPSGALEGL